MKRKLINVLSAIIAVLVMIGCSSTPKTKTIENLKAAYKGETTASAKYAAFAQKAKEEGFTQIAVLFEATSKAESIHANNHKTVLEKLGGSIEEFNPEFEVETTKENLQAAIDGETYESTTMYPDFLKAAEEEKAEDAIKSLTWAKETEVKHAEFYKAALAAIDENAVESLVNIYYVCSKCGNTYSAQKVDESCSFCMTKKENFIQIGQM